MIKGKGLILFGALFLSSCGDTPVSGGGGASGPVTSSEAKQLSPTDQRMPQLEGSTYRTPLLNGFLLALPHKVRAQSNNERDDGSVSRAVDVEYFDLDERAFLDALYGALTAEGFDVREKSPQVAGEGVRAYVSGPSGGRMVVIVNGNPEAQFTDERTRGTAFFQWAVLERPEMRSSSVE